MDEAKTMEEAKTTAEAKTMAVKIVVINIMIL